MKAKPEARQDTRRQRKQISTYPADWAWELLGGGASTVATAAVECWAQVLADATRENEGIIPPGHWKVLADWLGDRDVHEVVPHTVRSPGSLLATQLQDDWKDRDFAGLAKMVLGMDYAHVWAVLWALDWKQRTGASGEWWTLAARLN